MPEPHWAGRGKPTDGGGNGGGGGGAGQIDTGMINAVDVVAAGIVTIRDTAPNETVYDSKIPPDAFAPLNGQPGFLEIGVYNPDDGIGLTEDPKYSLVRLDSAGFCCYADYLTMGNDSVRANDEHYAVIGQPLAAAWRTETFALVDRPAGTWQANHAYTFGDWLQVTATGGAKRLVKSFANGTSGATQPTWPTTTNDQVEDGTVTWMDQGAAPTQGGVRALFTIA